MLCRWLMPARVTGPLPPCMARSSIAVTANRPLVVSLMVAPRTARNTRLIRSSISNPDQFNRLFIDYLRLQAKRLLGLAPRRLKLLDLLQNQLDTLVRLDAVIEHALHRLGKRVILRLGGHRVSREAQLRRLFLARLVELVADDDRPEQLRSRADDDAAAKRRMALALVPRRPAERHAVVQGTVVS